VKLDDTICYCFHITKRKIVNHIRIYQPKRASQISECGGAGTGCGWCIPFLKKYFAEQQRGQSEAADTLTPDDYAKLRAQYIREGRGVPAPGAIPLPPQAGPAGEECRSPD
jgi:bacterioferritin-associated ferredoxin